MNILIDDKKLLPVGGVKILKYDIENDRRPLACGFSRNSQGGINNKITGS